MLKSIYIKAIFVYLFYTVIGKALLINGTFWNNALYAFIIQSTVSAFFGMVFLYLFSNDDFFKFIKIIEKREMKKEKRWLKRFTNIGKVLTTIVIGVIAGPLLTALTASIILPKSKYKYLVVAVACIISSVVWLGAARNTFGLLF